jgi:hypothetical protein
MRYVQKSISNPVGKLVPMETAMLDICAALNMLKAGHRIQRPDSGIRYTSYFLKYDHGKQYLFVRQAPENSTELLEYPSTFDWDDLIATTWEVVSTTSTCH